MTDPSGPIRALGSHLGYRTASERVSLAALQFRKGARLLCHYDLNIPWRHEVRIEDQRQPEVRKAYPACIGGSGAYPPEDSGGPAAFMSGRDGLLSLDALEDLETTAEITGGRLNRSGSPAAPGTSVSSGPSVALPNLDSRGQHGPSCAWSMVSPRSMPQPRTPLSLSMLKGAGLPSQI
jgi:hypothetical protein